MVKPKRYRWLRVGRETWEYVLYYFDRGAWRELDAFKTEQEARAFTSELHAPWVLLKRHEEIIARGK